MANKDVIKQVIDDWQDENYVTSDTLFVYNKCGGWDSHAINKFQSDWIVLQKKLIKVGNMYESLDFIRKEVKRLVKENDEYHSKMKANSSKIGYYSNALLNQYFDGKN